MSHLSEETISQELVLNERRLLDVYACQQWPLALRQVSSRDVENVINILADTSNKPVVRCLTTSYISYYQDNGTTSNAGLVTLFSVMPSYVTQVSGSFCEIRERAHGDNDPPLRSRNDTKTIFDSRLATLSALTHSSKVQGLGSSLRFGIHQTLMVIPPLRLKSCMLRCGRARKSFTSHEPHHRQRQESFIGLWARCHIPPSIILTPQRKTSHVAGL